MSTNYWIGIFFHLIILGSLRKLLFIFYKKELIPRVKQCQRTIFKKLKTHVSNTDMITW